jgi:Aspartyl/Asparaginyl beta-hydroxylase
MIKYLQLPLEFDLPLMQQEVMALTSTGWKLHYNTKHYEGGWSILPLRSVNGSVDNLFSVHADAAGQMPYLDTVLLQQCPYITALLNTFECTLQSVRLMKLEAGAIIKEHSDYSLEFEEGEVRLHIPVFTNEKVDFYLDDERIPMKAGECWYMNLSLNHRVTNGGDTDRIHLVVDCLVNDWLREQFNKSDLPVKKLGEAVIKKDIVQLKLTIEELRRTNTPETIALALKLESELDN